MIVVSDTTPLITLMKAGKLDILHTMFGEILIPNAVFEELTGNTSDPIDIYYYRPKNWKDGDKIFVAFHGSGRNAKPFVTGLKKISEQLDGDFIIPAKILQDISAMMDGGGKIELAHSGSKIYFTFDNFLVTSRLIAGVYPPFERVFPKNNEMPFL